MRKAVVVKKTKSFGNGGFIIKQLLEIHVISTKNLEISSRQDKKILTASTKSK